MKNIYYNGRIYKIRIINQDNTLSKGTRNTTREIAIKNNFLKRLKK